MLIAGVTLRSSFASKQNVTQFHTDSSADLDTADNMAYQHQYVIGQQMHHPQQVVHHPGAGDAALQAAQLEMGNNQVAAAASAAALAIRRPFDPTAHELDANFRLTRFADLKGRGCKVPQDTLLKLLEGLQDEGNEQEHNHFMHMAIPRIGIGMDSSITPLRHGGLSLVQTTDFFYPIVEDPYMQGTKLHQFLYLFSVLTCSVMFQARSPVPMC